MKKLPLRDRTGAVIAHALLDDEDYQRVLNRGRWHLNSQGYPAHGFRVHGARRLEYLHRFLMGLRPGGPHVDHIDRNKLNNQKSNLRLATQPQNTQNLTKRRNSTSQYRGVGWHKATNNWRARVQLNGKVQYIGYFNTEQAAARAAKEARLRLMPFSRD